MGADLELVLGNKLAMVELGDVFEQALESRLDRAFVPDAKAAVVFGGLVV